MANVTDADLPEADGRLARKSIVLRWCSIAASVDGIALSICGRFIPPSMRLNTETHNQALLFLISHLIGPWIGFAVISYLYAIDPHPGIVLLLPSIAIAAFWLFPFALRSTGKFLPLALASVQNLACIILFISFFYGGFSSPFLSWLITVPLLAYFYLSDNARLRGIALAIFALDLAVFYLAEQIAGPVPSRVPLEVLSTAGALSLFCAGLYVTMMASYYGRIVDSRAALQREIHRHEQTAVMLVEAKEAAEEANRAKSSFLSTMSHELRTPLNAVIGFSELMVTETFGPIGHKNYVIYAKDIHDSGSRLLGIINDILQISKAELCERKPEDRLVDCRDFLFAAQRHLRLEVEKAGLKLELVIPNAMPQLRADPRMFKQILLKLLGNAVKFTPAGGRIVVEASASLQTGLCITIRDTGIGIAARDLDRVRQPFVQADDSLSRRHEGAGLGLPLVELMVRQHGGSFHIDSEEGKGTRALVQFPAERLVWPGTSTEDSPRASPLATTVELSAGERRASPRRAFGVPRLLVVEDDSDLCELFQRMLRRAGFAATGAANGKEALTHIIDQAVDLVITDMVMPEMDGVELMRILQNDSPTLPVIALSGAEDFMEYNNIAIHLGARAALRKPVSRSDLIRAVNDVLGASPAAQRRQHS